MTGEVVTRLACIDEYGALEALMRRSALALPEYRESLLAHPEAIAVPTLLIQAGQVVVADLDGSIAGFAAWLPAGGALAELDGVFVDPSAWRSGIGTALIGAVSAAAAQTGLKKLYVVANPSAEFFYRRCGFQKTGVTTTEFGPALTMLLDLVATDRIARSGTVQLGARFTRMNANRGIEDEE